MITMPDNTISVSLRGTGHCLPGAPVTSEELDVAHDLTPGHLRAETGVATRHYAGEMTQIEMGVRAAVAALEEAGLGPDDVDLVISASGVPFQTLPATAPLLMRSLGIADGQAAAFDVNSTCASFVSAMDLVARQVAAGVYRHVLIVSSEIASRGLPWGEQPEVAALFGDGAAAAVLGPCETGQSGIVTSLMRSYPSEYEACEIGAGGTRIDFHKDPEEFRRNAVFRMNGKDLFRITLRHFPGFVEELLSRARWRREDVDVVVPHQASPHALEHMSRQLGFAPERIVNLASGIGNQIAASIPTALDWARGEGRIGDGARVLILGTSAGVSFTGMALKA